MRLEDEIAVNEFSTITSKTIVNLAHTNNWIEGHKRDFFKPFSITSQQYNVLRILRDQQQEPATIGLLKTKMLDKMCDVSRMVERLRLKNLIERQANTADRRAVDILISATGLSLLVEIDHYMPALEQVTNLLSYDELEHLNILLDKIRG